MHSNVRGFAFRWYNGESDLADAKREYDQPRRVRLTAFLSHGSFCMRRHPVVGKHRDGGGVAAATAGGWEGMDRMVEREVRSEIGVIGGSLVRGGRAGAQPY